MAKICFAFAILLAICFCLLSAAPASQLLDADTIIRRITAEYEKLGGSSHYYPPEVGTLIDPNNFHLHF